MKIDCPHCGVHGSVDDSLAGSKLRCPKCSKVFLITEDILPETDDAGLMYQEILYDDIPQSEESSEQEITAVEEIAEAEALADPEEEVISEEDESVTENEETEDPIEEYEALEDPAESEESAEVEGVEETLAEDDTALQECSVCKQSFAPEFMVEIDSDLYCALCQPDTEDGELELSDEQNGEKELEDGLLAFMDDDSSDSDEKEDGPADEEELFLMDDESEAVTAEESGDVMAFMEDEDGLDEESVELQTCSGCGEALHPDFLDEVGSKRYCALCLPESFDGNEDEESSVLEEDDTVEEVEELGFDQDDDEMMLEEEPEISSQALLVDTEDDDAGGYPKELCSVCGERFHRDFMQEVDSKLYCGVCQPEVIEVLSDDGMGVAAATDTNSEVVMESEEAFESGDDFTIGELVKEAWRKTKGAKGAIWAGLTVMYLIVLTISFGGIAGFQLFYKGVDPTISMGVNSALQFVSSWLSMLMTGGIMLIGVRRALEQRVSWKMVFAGFSKTLTITIALVLQAILVVLGFILLVLPGIYLTVGYALVLPLILDKGLGPWEALETSRKAIHKKWWSVFGLYLVMLLIAMVASIPLGLGLIWVVPMYFVVLGVLYVRLFGAGEVADEDEEFAEDEAENVFDDDSEALFDDTGEEEQEELFEESKEHK